MKISEDRLEVLNKISEYEKLGGENFFNDVENDPPSKTLNPSDVDYLNKKLSNKFKRAVCSAVVNSMLKNYAAEHKIIIVGLDNLNVDTGAIVTTNHFNYFDSAPFIYAMKQLKGKHKFHVIIKEGNYQIKGKFGFLIKNYDTFPLSSNIKTNLILNQTIDECLSKKHYILVYPEQAMWWNYKKPRPFRVGAFRWAARNNVPVIPCFCTMEDLKEFENDGLPKQKLTYYVEKPIYPDKTLSEKENAAIMMRKNREACVAIYEKAYGKKLNYNE